jgi:hypothetical protein
LGPLLCLLTIIITTTTTTTIIIHFPQFAAVQLVLKRLPVSLTKHFVFTVLPKTF